MTTRSHLLALLLSFLTVDIAFASQESSWLEVGKPIEREIAGGQAHHYKLRLTADQYFHVVVTQRGVDVVVILSAPDGKKIIEADRPNSSQGEELISAVTESAGEYALVVQTLEPNVPSGQYEIKVTEWRAATLQDKARVTAERLQLDAEWMLEGKGTRAQAIEANEQALRLWQEIADPKQISSTLMTMGDLINGQGGSGVAAKAKEYYQQALTVRRALHDRAGEIETLLRLAIVTPGYDGLEFCEQALRIAQESKDRKSERKVLGNLGFHFLGLNRYEQAIEYTTSALAIARELKDRADEAAALRTLSDVYSQIGLFEKALECQEQSLLLYRELQNRNEEYWALVYLGVTVSRGFEDYVKAIGYYEQALRLAAQSSGGEGERMVLMNVGETYRVLKQYERANEYFEKVLSQARASKDRFSEAEALRSLGENARMQAFYPQALEHLTQSLAIWRELNEQSMEIETLIRLVAVYNLMGEAQKSFAYHQQARTLIQQSPSPDAKTEYLYNLALYEQYGGNLLRARTTIEEVLPFMESVRADLSSQSLRTSYLAYRAVFYERYVDILMQLHQHQPGAGLDALALQANERARARGLLENLSEARSDIRRGVDYVLLERERALARQYNEKAQQFLNLDQPEQMAALKNEINQLETEYERVQTAIRKSSPRYAALTQPQTLSLPEIQHQLDADTVLLEFALGEERSYLWAITRRSLTSYQLPARKIIEDTARQVYQGLTKYKRSNRGVRPLAPDNATEAQFTAAMTQLGELLLAPVAAQLGTNRLVIVADGALQYIPFAALPEPVANKKAARALQPSAPHRSPLTDRRPPLMFNHEILSLPSASVLDVQRKELSGRRRAPKTLAILADPVFDTNDVRLQTTGKKVKAAEVVQGNASAAPQRASFARSHITERLTGRLPNNAKINLPRLPFTRQEAEAILALTPKASRLKAIDFQANRAIVESGALNRYRYVHFATHGYLDSERPNLSALVLSLVDEQGKPQDGFLRAHEIYNWDLPAELVVLSACQTGLGKDVKGEGLVGLTRGFMYAGAARVIVSLWSVDDKATSELMAKLYEKMLQERQRPAAALRSAQIEMWRQKQWQAPYYWAAFILQGEWR